MTTVTTVTTARERAAIRASPRRFVTGDGVGLRVVESGPAQAPVTVVLAHCWTLDHTVWDGVVDALGPGVRVLRYDHRGHGRSAAAPAGTATIDRLADDLAELITERVPTGNVVLAGHSLGGMTIMALAERHPELVRARVGGLALVATSTGRLVGFRPRTAKLFLAAENWAGLRTARRDPRRRPLPPVLLRAGLRRTLFGTSARREDVDKVITQLAMAHPASMAGFRGQILRHSRLAALDVFRELPSAVVVGDADRLTPVGHARAMARALPDAGFVLFPGVGHMVPVERADELAELIAGLVGEVSHG